VLTELVVEALFALVCVQLLRSYARRRDPLMRDVALMFAAVAVLFVLTVARRTLGEPPVVVRLLASALLLGQPFLTIRLVRRVGAMPAWVYWSTLAGWVVSSALLLVGGGRAIPATTVVMVAVFVLTEAVAAAFLIRLARQRAGAPRTRLALAAAGTLLFALAIIAASAGAGRPAQTGAWQLGARMTALASALAYLLAFTPPSWLRRAWSDRAAATVVRRLVQTPADAPPEATWQSYARSVCDATGSTAAVILLSADDAAREVARVGLPIPGGTEPAGDHAELLDLAATTNMVVGEAPRRMPAAALAYARAAGAHVVTAVPLDLPTGRGVLLLLNRHRALFTDDDVQMLGDVSRQTAALAHRAELLSDRERLTGELSASLAALTTASQAKNDFMANMSHELRTPLNAIIGFSDLMCHEPLVGDQVTVPAEWVKHINSSGEHLLALINEILDLAKVESGKIELHREPLDLPAAIWEVATTLEALSQSKGLEVTVAVAPLRAYADPMRFRQIVTNLLSNAIKFTPGGGRIFIAGRRVGTDIAVSLADTGPGIAAEDRIRVFEEFQQAGDARAQSGGTGLGLALTRRLVEAHAGRIELESELGHGAKFTVYLPAADAPLTTSADGRTRSPGAGVLVIEDDAPTAGLLSAYLQEAGYEVSTAATGEQGLHAARTRNPEAILLDIHLPGIDGWQVLADLKHDDRLRHIPVVIISASDHSDVGVALGAVDYFVKPVDRHTLLSWLARNGLVPTMGRKHVTVLAIDDDPASLQLIDTSLSAEGIQVITADGGAAGLATAHARSFDLIICDLLMPQVDGFDVIAALHNNPDTRGTPVVVLTAHRLTDTDKARLSGKVVAVSGKGDDAGGLPELARTIGEVTGLTIHDDKVVA